MADKFMSKLTKNMRRRAAMIVLAFALFTGTAVAISRDDAVSRFHHYIRGRCGNLVYTCQGLVSFDCLLVGNQPGLAQWTCAGDVFERNLFTRKRRTCEVIASYAPNGKRVFGDKSCVRA